MPLPLVRVANKDLKPMSPLEGATKGQKAITYKESQLELPSSLHLKGLATPINRQHPQRNTGLSFSIQALPNLTASQMGTFSARQRRGGYLRVGGSMGPGDRAAAKSTAPMVSAMPAAAAPVMDMTSPALALSSSSLPTPLRLKILVTLLSPPPAAPASITNG
ncbi:MAG: hypothetical protein FRX49_12631 [Trebouxia sp. A1-2]|nr:MAG: hypothetical protein FRX49_12631 [Trebouxia sp. A1-2]